MLTLACASCGAAGPHEAEWPPLAKKWFDRADRSFRQADIEDAQLAVDNALRIVPERQEVRLLAARVALAQLEHDRAIQLLRGLTSTAARTIRGRALWYSNRIARAATALPRAAKYPRADSLRQTGGSNLAARSTRTPGKARSTSASNEDGGSGSPSSPTAAKLTVSPSDGRLKAM